MKLGLNTALGKTEASILLMLLGAAPLAGCVSQGRFDAAVRTSEQARIELQTREHGFEERVRLDNQRLDALAADLARHDKILEDDEARLSDCQTRANTLKDTLQVTSSMNAALRRAQIAALSRVELYRQVAHKLKAMVDTGQLTIGLREGRMVLQLPNDVLFDTGSATVKPAAVLTLKQVSAVLKTVPNHAFQVAGHTDNLPIHDSRFHSNWELSTARALEVVHLMTSQGVRAQALSAAGYGEFDPVMSNDAPEARAKNRRIEIVVQPNIDEFVMLPEP